MKKIIAIVLSAFALGAMTAPALADTKAAPAVKSAPAKKHKAKTHHAVKKASKKPAAPAKK